MPRILNFFCYFVGSICWVTFLGLLARYYNKAHFWYWVFFLLFLLVLSGFASFYGRKAYVGLLNTSDSVLFGVVISLFIGAILGGVMSHV